MGEEVLLSKLESLTRCIVRIKEHTPSSAKELESDCDSQDIICLNLERAVQICVDIASHISSEISKEAPRTMGESFALLSKNSIITAELAQKMSKAVGFRNIAVHQYQSLNWNIVYSVATKNIEDFKEFSKAVLEWNKNLSK